MTDHRRYGHIAPFIVLALMLAISLTSCQQGDEAGLIATSVPTQKKAAQPSPTPPNRPGFPTRTVATSQCVAGDAVLWSDARSYLGQEVTVIGPVVAATYAASSNGSPTFLDLGKAYPDDGRFVVLIWGSERERFSTPPEIAYLERTICVTGVVEEYRGALQMVVKRPSQIEVL